MASIERLQYMCKIRTTWQASSMCLQHAKFDMAAMIMLSMIKCFNILLYCYKNRFEVMYCYKNRFEVMQNKFGHARNLLYN
ncbi:hypothetical protein GUITHDRAFT_156678 [Guillardia theta CCMP2712]|uniref:Uncharacterized protein n=1 Tax=Guillardia theta (strain CCMP2712) TaxID=905079 RepID=L1I4C8_GUITC|nr:hypothetical protein GUITHDRAFT_156678 [Guillardia theta CCMP2712]EKX31096.1 hypothetical protein GUITHDRAFT_156678 [Guillardia theta CCMP2712]|eukprot:XP_005818076.1 hypothetical protein GUITHDRAFT_156678 [Guillardia theta CCMP2712]